MHAPATRRPLSAYCGEGEEFTEKVLRYAIGYAKQSVMDWKLFVSKQS